MFNLTDLIKDYKKPKNYWKLNKYLDFPGYDSEESQLQEDDVDDNINFDSSSHELELPEKQKQKIESRKKELSALIKRAEKILSCKIIPAKYFSLSLICKDLYKIHYNVYDLGDESLVEEYYEFIDKVDEKLLDISREIDFNIDNDAELAFNKSERVKGKLRRLLKFISNPGKYKLKSTWSLEVEKLNQEIIKLNDFMKTKLSAYIAG